MIMNSPFESSPTPKPVRVDRPPLGSRDPAEPVGAAGVTNDGFTVDWQLPAGRQA